MNRQLNLENNMKKETIVSKVVINISGLFHGGLRLKSPFGTD
jgi:hypothetical protein